MMVQCIIGPDPRSKNIHVGWKLLMPQKKVHRSHLSESRAADPALSVYFTTRAIPEKLA